MVRLDELSSTRIGELGEVERPRLKLGAGAELVLLDLPARDAIQLFSSPLNHLVREALLRHAPAVDDPCIEGDSPRDAHPKEQREKRQSCQGARTEYSHAEAERNRDQAEVIESPGQACDQSGDERRRDSWAPIQRHAECRGERKQCCGRRVHIRPHRALDGALQERDAERGQHGAAAPDAHSGQPCAGENDDHHAGLGNPVSGLDVAHGLTRGGQEEWIHRRSPTKVGGAGVPEVAGGLEVHWPVAAPGVIEGRRGGEEPRCRHAGDHYPWQLGCTDGESLSVRA